MTADIALRPAWPDEHEKILRLFGLPRPSRSGVHWLVATTGSARERLLGVAMVVDPLSEDATLADSPSSLLWRVLPTHAGTRTEQALIEYAIKAAAKSGCKQLSSFAALEVGNPTHCSLLEHGFSVSAQIDEYEAPFTAVWERCQRIYKLLEQRHRIPQEAEILPFESRLLPELRSIFHNTRIVGCLEFDAKLSPHHEEPIDLGRSTAIVLDQQLIGAMLVCPARDAPVYHVPGRWIAHGHRNSWVNAALIYNSVRQGVPLKLKWVRFVAHRDVHPETAVLAEKLGARQVRSLQRMTIFL